MRDDASDVLDDLRCVPGPRGDGRTRHNWSVLARAAAEDLDVARVVEAHLDAVTILDELDAAGPPPGSRWGVWAAESRSVGPVTATADTGASGPDRWRLVGPKPWCSGVAGTPRFCTHALITAHSPDGPGLFAMDLDQDEITVRPGEWAGAGMVRSAAATVDIAGARAVAVGAPRAYLERAGFWHGACAVAAAWFGGAAAVVEPLREAAATGRLDEHGHAHLGAVDAALAAARELLRAAATAIDDPRAREEPIDVARRRALQVRAVVEHAVDAAITRTARAGGPGPLVHDGEHARRVADLGVYVRQSHAERDLAALGRLVPAEVELL